MMRVSDNFLFLSSVSFHGDHSHVDHPRSSIPASVATSFWDPVFNCALVTPSDPIKNLSLILPSFKQISTTKSLLIQGVKVFTTLGNSASVRFPTESLGVFAFVFHTNNMVKLRSILIRNIVVYNSLLLNKFSF